MLNNGFFGFNPNYDISNDQFYQGYSVDPARMMAHNMMMSMFCAPMMNQYMYQQPMMWMSTPMVNQYTPYPMMMNAVPQQPVAMNVPAVNNSSDNQSIIGGPRFNNLINQNQQNNVGFNSSDMCNNNQSTPMCGFVPHNIVANSNTQFDVSNNSNVRRPGEVTFGDVCASTAIGLNRLDNKSDRSNDFGYNYTKWIGNLHDAYSKAITDVFDSLAFIARMAGQNYQLAIDGKTINLGNLKSDYNDFVRKMNVAEFSRNESAMRDICVMFAKHVYEKYSSIIDKNIGIIDEVVYNTELRNANPTLFAQADIVCNNYHESYGNAINMIKSVIDISAENSTPVLNNESSNKEDDKKVNESKSIESTSNQIQQNNVAFNPNGYAMNYQYPANNYMNPVMPAYVPYNNMNAVYNQYMYQQPMMMMMNYYYANPVYRYADNMIRNAVCPDD